MTIESCLLVCIIVIMYVVDVKIPMKYYENERECMHTYVMTIALLKSPTLTALEQLQKYSSPSEGIYAKYEVPLERAHSLIQTS